MSLLDTAPLGRIQNEFQLSMRRLLRDLCHDLERHYAGLASVLALPIKYFQFLTHAFQGADYSNWKVVGWIEALNDLVYFLDVLAQLRKERNPGLFAEQLLHECEQKFFENSYTDDLFPQSQARAFGLEGRLHRLCMRQAREVTEESLFFDPQWPMAWLAREGRQTWEMPASLDHRFERGERAGTVPIGTQGRALLVPRVVAQDLRGRRRRPTWFVTSNDITLKLGRPWPLCRIRGKRIEYHWALTEVVAAATTPYGPLTVGPTLQYGKDREPTTLSPTAPRQVVRIARAWKAIRLAWPEAHRVLELLTSRVVPLKARGVVSFSYRHRPGLSFVNCFHRDNLDLIDDLIHENSHHHLNLLLRKHVLYRGDHNQQIFYSPWRRSLRPVRGILHATFTFTMGAQLFERLSSWAETSPGLAQWREAGLSSRDLLRARFRCLEEIESVRYSLRDLQYASGRLKWLTGSGARLVRQLEQAIAKTERHISKHRHTVLASPYGRLLDAHNRELRQARHTYGPGHG
jgi:HEXXH motif-containing protein